VARGRPAAGHGIPRRGRVRQFRRDPAASGTPSSATSAPTGAASSTAALTVEAGHSARGTIITDGKGITVYMFEGDSASKSACYGQCAAAWPPVLASGAPAVAGSGVKASLLGTAVRTDGSSQLTYAGHRLYYFSGGHRPADVAGQGLQAFGAGWDALRPSGAQAG
jgi:predicted lipoprotein with Yx(FWY)xxD motif